MPLETWYSEKKILENLLPASHKRKNRHPYFTLFSFFFFLHRNTVRLNSRSPRQQQNNIPCVHTDIYKHFWRQPNREKNIFPVELRRAVIIRRSIRYERNFLLTCLVAVYPVICWSLLLTTFVPVLPGFSLLCHIPITVTMNATTVIIPINNDNVTILLRGDITIAIFPLVFPRQFSVSPPPHP